MNQDYAELHAVTTTDRLTATLFLAGLLHGVLILGVTFATPREPSGGDAVTLRVTVVPPQNESLLDPATDLLAQANVQGAGEPLEQAQMGGMLSPIGFDQPLANTDEPVEPIWQDDTLAEQSAVVFAETDAALPAHAEQSDLNASSETIAGVPDASFTLGENPSDPEGVQSDAVTGPSARESEVAAYLVAWRARVEQVGSRNFPRTAAADAGEHPVVEVVLAADGSLEEATISRSSGRADLDRAALEILRIAAPFPAFPEELRAEHSRLRFAYEWRFSAAL